METSTAVAPSSAAGESLQLDVAGHYVLAGRPPLPCSALALDDEGLHLRLLVRAPVGAPINAKFDAFGAVAGRVRRVDDDRAVIEIGPDLRRTLVEQISFIQKPSRDGLQRRYLRIQPRHAETRIRTSGNKLYPAAIEDISLSGARISTAAPLQIGDLIIFQRLTQAKVVRALDEERFGVEFTHSFLPEELTWAIRL